MQTGIFYYTLAVLLFVLLDASVLFPNPRNFIFAFLLVPILFFFLVSKKTPTQEDNSSSVKKQPIFPVFRSFAVILLLLGLIGAFTYSLKQPSVTKLLKAQSEMTNMLETMREDLLVKTDTDKTKELSDEIKSLRREITMLRNDMDIRNKVLGIQNINDSQLLETLSPTPPPAGGVRFVTIKDSRLQTVNVYQEKSLTSKVVGKAQYGKTYEFLKKENDYYYITLSLTVKGWVQTSVMQETNTAL